MEQTSLHPYAPETVSAYIALLRGGGDEFPGLSEQEIAAARHSLASLPVAKTADFNALSWRLARVLSAREPVFMMPGLSFTGWEARIDRGLGMLLRPPSRMLADGGLDQRLLLPMPIRLDLSAGMMGGACTPPRLIGDLVTLLESRLERTAKRLAAANYDAVLTLGFLLEAARYAAERDLGLFEAIDVIAPGVQASWPAGAIVMFPDRKRLDPLLVQQIEAALRPPPKPGLFSRWASRLRGDQAGA